MITCGEILTADVTVKNDESANHYIKETYRQKDRNNYQYFQCILGPKFDGDGALKIYDFFTFHDYMDRHNRHLNEEEY